MELTEVVDGDGHVLEKMGEIIDFMPSGAIKREPRSLFPPFDHFHADPIRYPRGLEGPRRNGDAQEWMEFLDEVAIAKAALYPTEALSYGKIQNADTAVVVTRAYNDWLKETYLKISDRFIGMGIIPVQDPAEAVLELRRVVDELGMAGAMIPSRGTVRHLGAREYWPIYEEASRLGCALAIHGGCHDGLGMDGLNIFGPVLAYGHPFGQAISFAAILGNGLFDRFPDVRFAFLEGGVAWLIMALERLGRSYETMIEPDFRGALPSFLDRSELIRYVRGLITKGRLVVGCEGNEEAIAFSAALLGSNPFMYSSDFPHEVTIEGCKKELEALKTNETIGVADKAAVLHGNARSLYRMV